MGLDGELTAAMIDKVSDILAASPGSSDFDSDADAGVDAEYYTTSEAALSPDEISAAAASASAAAYAQAHNIKKPASLRANLRVDIKVTPCARSFTLKMIVVIVSVHYGDYRDAINDTDADNDVFMRVVLSPAHTICEVSGLPGVATSAGDGNCYGFGDDVDVDDDGDDRHDLANTLFRCSRSRSLQQSR
jgi:hypothetical protein